MTNDPLQRKAPYEVSPRQAGVTEVLAYGTAVIVEPANPGESYRA